MLIVGGDHMNRIEVKMMLFDLLLSIYNTQEQEPCVHHQEPPKQWRLLDQGLPLSMDRQIQEAKTEKH
jgi:hypothetical protein